MTLSKPPCLLAFSLLLLAGCASAPRETARPASNEAAASARQGTSQNLRKGMTEAEIRKVWGAPKAVHAGHEGETILVYEFDIRTHQKLVATTMVAVPFFDPITGAAQTVMEPVLTPENETIFQTIVLQLRDGRLASWARRLGKQRTLN